MKLCHLVRKEKGWNSNEEFQAAEWFWQESYSLWRVLWALYLCRLFTCTKRLYNTLKEREKPEKHYRSILKC